MLFSLGYYENYYLELIHKYGEKSKCDAFMWGKDLREKYHTLFKLLQEMNFSSPDGNHVSFIKLFLNKSTIYVVQFSII